MPTVRRAFTWNRKAARYVDARGRFVSPARVRAMLEQAVGAERRAIRAAAAFRTGAQDASALAAFERAMREGIRTTHLMAAMAAKGGYAQMTPADYGRVGQTVRFHYRKLEGWMQALAADTAPRDGRLLVRADLYAGASRGTHYRVAGQVALAAGYTTERNVLGATEQHCPTCVAETDRGAVPIGTLIPVGQRACLGNCQCTLIYEAA